MECCICLEKCITNDSSMLYICEHIFHTSCIKNLLYNNHIACPLCRNDIIGYVNLSCDKELENYKYLRTIFSNEYKKYKFELINQDDYERSRFIDEIFIERQNMYYENTNEISEIDIQQRQQDYQNIFQADLPSGYAGVEPPPSDGGWNPLSQNFLQQREQERTRYELEMLLEEFDGEINIQQREQEDRIRYELEMLLEEMMW